MPRDLDPADVARTDGVASLTERLAGATNFGARLIDLMIEEWAEKPFDRATRIWLARDVARVIGALPPEQWIDEVRQVEGRLDLPPGFLALETLDAGTRWSDDPDGNASRLVHSAHRSNRAALTPRCPTSTELGCRIRRHNGSQGEVRQIGVWTSRLISRWLGLAR